MSGITHTPPLFSFYTTFNIVVLHAIQATVTPPSSESEKRMRKVPISLACEFMASKKVFLSGNKDQ